MASPMWVSFVSVVNRSLYLVANLADIISKMPSPLAVFHCNLPDPLNAKLEFYCREPSCGALEGEEKAAKLAEEDYTVDPNFFDEGYSMAGSTGFKVRGLVAIISYFTYLHMKLNNNNPPVADLDWLKTFD